MLTSCWRLKKKKARGLLSLVWGRGEEESVGYGAGCAEVGEELETEADHKVPDVSGHLGAGDKHPPDENHQQGVEGVADVPQSGEEDREGDRE